MTLVMEDEALPVARQKQQSAFPPNFVHSLDATHMLMTSLKVRRHPSLIHTTQIINLLPFPFFLFFSLLPFLFFFLFLPPHTSHDATHFLPPFLIIIAITITITIHRHHR